MPLLKTDLKQARVLITRPAHQNENLTRLIRDNNGIPICFPTIEIVPLILEIAELQQVLTLANKFIFTINTAA